ncbi:unnamed protein product [Symbiodinium pilosum]|uniref:Uncharacterized protein n=1 Tax=Symbiodinium pilosum TaxID=2952 RepID=A0A812RQI3_SYMPI|nr:unnamed protein product [Symbiodinium pilosum]
MEDAFKALLSSVHQASQELALLTQDEDKEVVAHEAGGGRNLVCAGDPASGADAASQPSQRVPSQAAHTESSASSSGQASERRESLSGADSHDKTQLDMVSHATGSSADSASRQSLREGLGVQTKPVVGVAGMHWGHVDLNAGLDDSGMLKQISFMSNEEKHSQLSLNSRSAGSQAAGASPVYHEGSESSAGSLEDDLPVFGALPSAHPPADEPLPSFGPPTSASRPWSPGRPYSGSHMQLDQESDGSLAADSDGVLDLDFLS